MIDCTDPAGPDLPAGDLAGIHQCHLDPRKAARQPRGDCEARSSGMSIFEAAGFEYRGESRAEMRKFQNGPYAGNIIAGNISDASLPTVSAHDSAEADRIVSGIENQRSTETTRQPEPFCRQ